MDKKDCPYKETIIETYKIAQKNNRKLVKIENRDWYNNKELHEKMTSGFEEFRTKLDTFNENFHKYNGLLEKTSKIADIAYNNKENIEKIQNSKKVKSSLYDNWRDWLGWIIAFLLGLAQFKDIILAIIR